VIFIYFDNKYRSIIANPNLYTVETKHSTDVTMPNNPPLN